MRSHSTGAGKAEHAVPMSPASGLFNAISQARKRASCAAPSAAGADAAGAGAAATVPAGAGARKLAPLGLPGALERGGESSMAVMVGPVLEAVSEEAAGKAE